VAGEIAGQEIQVARRRVGRQDHIPAEYAGRTHHLFYIGIFDIRALNGVDEHRFGNFLFAVNHAVHALYFPIQHSDALHRTNLALQNHPVVGFYQEIVAAGLYALRQRFFIAHRGQENYRHEVINRSRLDLARGFVTVEHRHHDVHEDNAWIFLVEEIDGFLPIDGFDGLVTLFYQ
jgi:hypothetical protein